MGLASIHACGDSKVISTESAQETEGRLIPRISQTINSISSEQDHGKYTVADIDRLVLASTRDQPVHIKDNDEDVPMIDMDNEDEVELVSNLLSNKRLNDSQQQNLALSKEVIDLSFPMMTPTRLKTMFVVDTNFIISHLNTLETLRRLSSRFHHQIVIPSTVIQELDGLKNSPKEVIINEHGKDGNDMQAIGLLARWANDWIYKNLANLDSSIMGQKLRQTINPHCVKDDAILDCCLYFKEKLECFVVLLSNDKNLCLKALTEGILTVSHRKGMSAQLIASKAYEENITLFGRAESAVVPVADLKDIDIEITGNDDDQSIPDFPALSAEIYHEVTETIIHAIYHVMTQEYGEDLDLIEFDKKSVSDLAGVTRCLSKYWISVFAEYFKGSRIKKNDWKNFPVCLTSFPSNSMELETLVKFWEDILVYLYSKRTEEDKEKLQSLVDRWRNLIQVYQ